MLLKAALGLCHFEYVIWLQLDCHALAQAYIG